MHRNPGHAIGALFYSHEEFLAIHTKERASHDPIRFWARSFPCLHVLDNTAVDVGGAAVSIKHTGKGSCETVPAKCVSAEGWYRTFRRQVMLFSRPDRW